MKDKIQLSNLSIDGQRKTRNNLALKSKKPIDRAEYNKKYQAKSKKARDFWKEWF